MEDLQAALLQVFVPVDLYLLKSAAFPQKAASGTGIAAEAVSSCFDTNLTLSPNVATLGFLFLIPTVYSVTSIFQPTGGPNDTY
jgi:hypothetical protein